jgi:hypothetical protein
MFVHNLVGLSLGFATADGAFKFNAEEIANWVSLLNLC